MRQMRPRGDWTAGCERGPDSAPNGFGSRNSLPLTPQIKTAHLFFRQINYGPHDNIIIYHCAYLSTAKGSRARVVVYGIDEFAEANRMKVLGVAGKKTFHAI